MSTEDLLNERNETHGPFTENARVSQLIKAAMQGSDKWNEMEPVHREALEYIAGKIGRLCAGDFSFDDTWDDIAGYAKLPKKFNHGKDTDITYTSTPDNTVPVPPLQQEYYTGDPGTYPLGTNTM